VRALTGTLFVAVSLLHGSALLSAAAQEKESRPPLRLLDVPFISQSEALCGGAAAAMVLRYWGETGVQAEDFASLVDSAAAGITTTDLTAALQRRGATAVAANSSAALARAELAAGRAPIALIEDRPGVLHYVVLVGWHERAVVFHDPARTPFVVMHPADFERRWRASGNWMLAVAPGAPASTAASLRLRGSPDAMGTSTLNTHAPSGSSPGAQACDALLEEGARLAQAKDLSGAERLLADATYQCPGAAPLRELAGLRLLQRRWSEVRDLAGRAVVLDGGDAHAWRLLATSRYVDGDATGALDAWNRAGEPVVDLVSASGLQRTTHRSVERLLGLEAGEVLTSGDFARARRRLDELPAAFATRLEYVARGAGQVEVRAHIAERPVVPRGWLSWAAIAGRAGATRELAFGVSSLSHRGERLEARWRFWPHRPAYGISMSAPAGRLGVITVDASSEEQPFTSPDVPAAERSGARGRIGSWATGTLRWELRGGLDRWARQGTFGVAGAGATIAHRGTRVTLGGDAWLGERAFGLGEIAAEWVSSRELRGTVVTARGGVQAVGANAPLDIWAAGDTGHARATLLRAHPVLQDGRLDVQRLGRLLQHAGLEIQRWRPGPGLVSIGVAGFLDIARTDRRREATAGADADAGVGLRLAIPGQRGLFRVDIAHGLRDGRDAISVAWQP
jgi:hypothetical protein